MKFILALLVISTFAFAGPETKTKTLPVSPNTTKTTKPSAKAQEVLKEKEDCDTKAKKEVKIEPESISLGGNTGCSLDEI